MSTKTKKKINSKAKGKLGELEIAAILTAAGLSARRSVQHCGASGEAADVLTSVPWLHVEVKRVEALNVNRAYDRALKDATAAPGCPRTAVVFHRCSRKGWLATLALDDFLALLAAILPAEEEKRDGEPENNASADG